MHHIRAMFDKPESRSSGGGGGGQAAKDALGNDIKADTWLKSHLAGDRSLSQGLKVHELVQLGISNGS
jgi:hypothetical protein